MMAQGPFRVKRVPKRGGWKIVNRHGEDARLGYRDRETAQTVCDLMNGEEKAGKS